MATDKSRFIAAFLSEAEDYIRILEQGLVRLEKETGDIPLINELFRAAHTLKGCSRMMGYTEISDKAHAIEDILGRVKEGKETLPGPNAEAVFRLLDDVKAGIAVVAGKAPAPAPTPAAAPVPEAPVKAETKPAEVSPAAAAPAAAAPVPVPVSVSSAPVKKAPVLPPNGNGNGNGKKAAPPPREEMAAPAQAEEEYMRVPLSRINELLNLMGEIVVNKVKSSHKVDTFKRLCRDVRVVERQLHDLKNLAKEALGIPDEVIFYQGNILRASAEMSKAAGFFSRLHEMELELSRVRTSIGKITDNVQTEFFHLNPVIEELQHKMKEIRMLPCSTIFDGFPRLVRDLAHECGKEIDLRIDGSQTELDKKVLESVRGPLIHILRNAVDHGIEPAEERRKAGKPSAGVIAIRAAQERGRVMIEISDDGRGIDLEEVRTTAVRKGIATEEDLAEMTEQEILHLVFAPGFSTSLMITDVSGRGVGLDVVRSELEKLKGTVNLTSRPGEGTSLRIELPITIAVLEVLLIEAGGHRWAFPVSHSQKNIQVTGDAVSTIQNRLMVRTEGRWIPAMILSDVLGLRSDSAPRHAKKEKEVYTVLIVQSMHKEVGFVIDRILGQDEVFLKGFGSHLDRVTGMGGAAVLADGSLVLILDPHDIIRHAQSAEPASRIRKGKDRQRRKRILVVEDSLTTRELEKSILENSGYEVQTAIDGLDGMEKLQSSEFHAIVSDIQMPRMDGFEFCREVKLNDKFHEIPFVFVTALAKDEEKRRGLELGAQAYITKKQFDQGNLLDTIERLTG